MDADSRTAIIVLEAIAAASERLVAVSRDMRSRPEVSEVQQNLTVRNYQLSGPEVEGYVDVQLVSGKSIAWLLDIRWDEAQWKIESRVVGDGERDSGGQNTLEKHPTRIAVTADGFVRELELATAHIVDSCRSMDLRM